MEEKKPDDMKNLITVAAHTPKWKMKKTLKYWLSSVSKRDGTTLF